MKKTILAATLCIGALTTACSTDEQETFADPMPLKIAGVTVSDSQTRISEGTSATQWEGGETIGVQIGDGKAGEYTVNSDGTVTAVTPCYWQSSASQTVTAWYPYDQTVDLSDQSQGLAYSLKAEAKNVSFDQSTTLTFYNQLAKVRVKVLDANNNQITYAPVKINGIAMHLNSTDKCYEACLKPGTLSAKDEIDITINNKTAKTTLANEIQLDAGTVNTIELTLSDIPELTIANNITINDNGTYYITGSGSGTITINGSPTVILDNTSFTTANNVAAISVKGGTPTIILSGNNTFKSSSNYYTTDSQIISLDNGAGVIVDGQGSGTMTVTAQYYSTYDALIGAKKDGTAGNIVIKNATLDFSTDDNQYYFSAPIIGSGYAADASCICGNITIENSTLNVSTSYINNTPAIGAGIADSYDDKNATSKCGDINITNSTLNINISGKSSYPFIGSSVAYCYISKETSSDIELTAVSSCGNVTITLKEGDSKDDFLARLVGKSNYSGDKIGFRYASIENNSGSTTKATATSSIGTITWKDSNGNVIETEEAKTNTETN